jgi:hypothetical protein
MGALIRLKILQKLSVNLFQVNFKNHKILNAIFYRFYFEFKNKQRNTQASSQILPTQRQI